MAPAFVVEPPQASGLPLPLPSLWQGETWTLYDLMDVETLRPGSFPSPLYIGWYFHNRICGLDLTRFLGEIDSVFGEGWKRRKMRKKGDVDVCCFLKELAAVYPVLPLCLTKCIS